jgi:putative heme-binding domain-containing protein
MPRTSRFCPRDRRLCGRATVALLLAVAALCGGRPLTAAEPPKPLKALLIVGGCCHDYTFQKRIIADGIAARAHVEFTVVQDGGSSTDSKIKLYEDPKWADAFDVILHDECFANVKEQAWMDKVLAPHRAGKPAVLLHCAMHCYRSGTDEWFKFCGIHSTGHGPQVPIALTCLDPASPITKAGGDWTTIQEELYNNVKVFDTARPLQKGVQHIKKKDGTEEDVSAVVTWTNDYGGTRVFATTLGHNSYTCADPRYLDMVTRGLLWACGKSQDDYLKSFDAAKHKFEWSDQVQPPNAKPPQAKGPQPTKAPEKPAANKQSSSSPAALPSPVAGEGPGVSGKAKENVALGRPVEASSVQGGRDAKYAVDGDWNTRWCANGGRHGQWLVVDLGSPQKLTGCRITWEFGDGAYHHRVDASDDGSVWKSLVDCSSETSSEQIHTHAFAEPTPEARYVRLSIIDQKPGHWASVVELELFGTNDAPAKSPSPPPAAARADDSAAELLKGIKVPAEFTASIYAVPPQVGYPTCLSAAPDGTLYVGVDENGSLDRAPNRGRIVRCRDTDDDGRADEFIEFAKMDSPRGVAWDGDRLYVLHPPTLAVYHDADGDGKSERHETLVEGIGFDLNFRGADHTTNGIRLGIDGFLYIAVGDYGFIKATGTDGRTLQLHGGGVVRVRTDGSDLEIVSRGQRNIYDVAVDPQMNLFTRDNTNDGGGWNVRLSHVVPGGNYGYPRLFTNFPDEIIPALVDYGGGSPCGALYLDEPQAFPEPYGRALYTVEWGRGGIMRHPLTPNGATFTAGQEPFISLPRPTDMDVDARGNLYISSWKDGSFTYSGPNVGFVVRVRANSAKPESGWLGSSVASPQAPDSGGSLRSTPATPTNHTTAQLVELLASPSGVVRHAAQRELLRRDDAESAGPALVRLAEGNGDPAVRAAAIFTLGQLRGATPFEAVVGLASIPALRETVLRVMADRARDAQPALAGRAADHLKDADPRVRLAAARALGRLGQKNFAEALLPLAADPDPITAHVAIDSLVELNANGACLAAMENSTTSPELFAACCRVLQQLHEESVVDGLLARRERFDGERQRAVVAALCRLHFREAEWDGKWWGTRPDTRGPYYYPTAWEATPRIDAALKSLAASAAPEMRSWLLVEALRNRIELPGVEAALVARGRAEIAFRPTALRMLAALSSMPQEGRDFLVETARDEKLPGEVRALAYNTIAKLAKSPEEFSAAVRAFATIGLASEVGELKNPRNDFLKAAANASRLATLVELTAQDDGAVRRFALTALLMMVQEPKTPQSARDEVSRLVDAAAKEPARSVDLLYAIAAADADGLADLVQTLRKSPVSDVKEAAEFAAKELRLDQRAKNAKTIAQFAFEDVQAKLAEAAGDRKLGEKLFVKQGCINCHAVTPNEPPKGPFLGGIAQRYKRSELIESILKPSQKLAQGFETQFVATDDGIVVEGFVVRESGEELELRGANGISVVVPKKKIDERGRRELSVMPTGLADRLTLDDLASILAYLESLKGK